MNIKGAEAIEIYKESHLPTFRWLTVLATWWSRKIDVLSRGYSGYNTRSLISVLLILNQIYVDGP